VHPQQLAPSAQKSTNQYSKSSSITHSEKLEFFAVGGKCLKRLPVAFSLKRQNNNQRHPKGTTLAKAHRRAKALKTDTAKFSRISLYMKYRIFEELWTSL
jgi:hypothetical protein